VPPQAYFEEVLTKNPHGPEWLVGDRLTVADLHVYHYVCAAEHHYASWFKVSTRTRGMCARARRLHRVCTRTPPL
jgi:glutathione S-transferase